MEIHYRFGILEKVIEKNCINGVVYIRNVLKQ